MIVSWEFPIMEVLLCTSTFMSQGRMNISVHAVTGICVFYIISFQFVKMSERESYKTFPTPSINTDVFEFEGWSFAVKKGPIIKSVCSCSKGGSETEDTLPPPCHICQFAKELKLPQLPEMIFPDNKLALMFIPTGSLMEFGALEALMLVNADKDENNLKVSATKEWTEARKNVEGIGNVVKPFDWTFTTPYKGTLNDRWTVTTTEERIDLEKLKVREPILFYQELTLFEDELADNGCSEVTVRFRVMPSGFFILQRQYVRVDHVLVRVNETRIHWNATKDYLIREFTSRQNRLEELTEEQKLLVMNPMEISQHLKLIEQTVEKLEF